MVADIRDRKDRKDRDDNVIEDRTGGRSGDPVYGSRVDEPDLNGPDPNGPDVDDDDDEMESELADGPSLTNEEFARLYPMLRRFAAVVSDSDMDPDELVQEALVGLLRLPAGHVRDPSMYLRRSIVNAVARERHRLKRLRELQRSLGAGTVGRPADYPSELKMVLSLFKASDRGLLYLVDVERLPIGAAAEIVGLSAVAARARLSRARRAAQQALRLERKSDGDTA